LAFREIWVYLGLVLLFGAAVGWAIAMRVSRANFVAQLRATTDELEHRNVSAASELRTVQARAQRELELARLSFKRQLASAGDNPRVAMLDAEERLRAAYDELDRLRRAVPPSRPANAKVEKEKPDGFAATLVMPE
jgi:hypothetical protein